MISLDPDNADTYNHRAFAFDELGQYQSAISDLTTAYYELPLPSYSYYNSVDRLDPFTHLAAVNASKGQYDATMAYLTHATFVAPSLPRTYNDLCWWGSLIGRVDEVFEACEQAIELALEYGWAVGKYRGSRGLVRALTGDIDGAIEDFDAYVEWSKVNNQYRAKGIKREAWIIQLKAGNNPFNESTLEELQNE